MSSSVLALRLATEPVVHDMLEHIAREGARRALQRLPRRAGKVFAPIHFTEGVT